MYPSELYQNLLTLCADSDAFFYKDFPSDQPDSMYRIFNYRLTSYSDFMKPGALECRGSMFLVERDGTYIDMVCRPPKKFFNLNENPMTMGLDLTNLVSCMVKEDGSLMSTYIHTDGALKLKSKGSTGSVQAEDAMKFLSQNPALRQELQQLASRDFTINLEWVAPWNRIVVGYQKPGLVALSIIDNANGNQMAPDFFFDDDEYPHLQSVWVEQFQYEGDLIDVVKNLHGSEGVVGITANGVPFKLKGDWYLSLHRNKDSVSNSKALIELVLMEKTDDLKSMFVDDQVVIDKIVAYETSISNVYNQTVRMVESYHNELKQFDRKGYAIAAKERWGDNWGFHAQMTIMQEKDYESQIKNLMIRNASNYILKEFEGNSVES